MDTPDFEAMTIEEIEAWRGERREKMRELREEILLSKPEYDRKLALQSLGARLRLNVEGLTREEVDTLLAIVEKGEPRPGDVVVTPETGDPLAQEDN